MAKFTWSTLTLEDLMKHRPDILMKMSEDGSALQEAARSAEAEATRLKAELNDFQLKNRAAELVVSQLRESKLPLIVQRRLEKLILENNDFTKDDQLDESRLKESVALTIREERQVLGELSGSAVKGMGSFEGPDPRAMTNQMLDKMADMFGVGDES